MVLALIFAELLAGGVLVVSAITGHTPSEVVKGEAETVLSLKETMPLKGEKETSTSTKNMSDETSSGESSTESQAAEENTASELAAHSAGTRAKNPSKAASGLSWQELEKYVREGRVPEKDFHQAIKELESGQLAKITPLAKQAKVVEA